MTYTWTGKSDIQDSVERALDYMNSGYVNFSVVSENSKVREVVTRYSVSEGTVEGAGTPNALAYTDVRPAAIINSTAQIFVLSDNFGRRGPAIAAIMHETLHHDEVVDALSNEISSSTTFSNFSLADRTYIRSIIEEKMVRDTVEGMDIIDKDFFDSGRINADIQSILDESAYTTGLLINGEPKVLSPEAKIAIENYMATSYTKPDFTVNGITYHYGDDGKPVPTNPNGNLTIANSNGPTPSLIQAIGDTLHDLGQAIADGFAAFTRWVESLFSGGEGAGGDAVVTEVTADTDNAGTDTAKPIILDLDGDGVEININGNVSYDMDGDGFTEQTAWAGPQDGFLIIDLNEDGSHGTTGDGKITQLKELFLSKWLEGDIATDLQALSTFDKWASRGGNNDGILNHLDDIWSELKVWQDQNQNGVVDSGEFKTLGEWGITKIDLGYQDGTGYGNFSNNVTVRGTTLHGTASFFMNGEKRDLGDVELAYDAQGWMRVDTDFGYEIRFENGRRLRYAVLTAASNASIDLDAQVLDGARGDGRANLLSAMGVDTAHTRSVQISGGLGDDTVIGGANDDMLSGDAGADSIRGGDGNDLIFIDAADLGSGGAVFGGRGVDTVMIADTSGVFIDLNARDIEAVIGGDGADTMLGSQLTSELTLRGADGADSIVSGEGDDNLSGDSGADTLRANSGDDQVFGGNGEDYLAGNGGDDFIMGGDQNDQLIGGDGDDDLLGGDGSDELLGGDDDDMIYGGGGADRLDGGNADDFLEGGGGNDTLFTFRGDDTLFGGSGDDMFRIVRTDQYADTDIMFGWVILQGGRGNDSVYLVGDRSDWEWVRVGSGSQYQFYRTTPNGGKIVVDVQDIETVDFVTGASLNLVSNENANTSDDYIRRNHDPYTGDGWAGWTSVTSNGFTQHNGPSEAWGWMGNDALAGSDGNTNFYGGSGQDNLTGYSGDDTLNGGSGADGIYGGEDDDTLTGSSGSDRIYGGTGNDLTNANSGSDAVWVGSGNDVAYGGTGSDYLVGGDGHDLVEGGTGSDQISGGDGFDTLRGDTGFDRLYGDAGNDVIEGGDGSDYLYGGAGADTLRGNAGFNMLAGGAGDDLVSGGDDDDQLAGGDGDDTLNGGIGRDVLLGGAGQDSLNGGTGVLDMISYQGSGTSVLVDLETGMLSGGAATGDIMLEVEQASGSDHSDTLRGSTVDNVLIGGAGEDSIAGRDGNDDLAGGDGNDSLYGGNGFDRIWGDKGDDLFFGGAGEDTFIGGAGDDTVTYEALNQGVVVDMSIFAINDPVATGEAVGDRFIGVDNLKGTDFADYLGGTDGNNRLIGDAGNDTLDGRDGADTLNGGSGSDLVTYDDSETAVTVDLENVALNTGEAKGDVFVSIEDIKGSTRYDDLRGNAGDNWIAGGGGSDFIAGRDGTDALYGGFGTDTIWGGDGNDTLNGGAGDDVLVDSGGADTFEFGVDGDADIITQFDNNADKILLSGLGLTSSAQAMTFATQSGDNVVFDFGSGDILTVRDMTIANIANDLLFA